MPPPDGAPPVPEVSLDPGDDFRPQPCNVHAGVVPTGHLALSICGARDIDNVDESVGMAQVVEELVAEALALVGSRDKTGNIEQLYRNRAAAINTRAIAWLAPGLEVKARAGTLNLQVSNGSLRVDGGESGGDIMSDGHRANHGTRVWKRAIRKISCSQERSQISSSV